MGIESFFGGYIKKNFRGCVTKTLPQKVSSLFVDCNGIFHSCAQKVYGYGEYEGVGMPTQDSKTLIKEIEKKIEEILKVTAPEHNFILAPDGVAVSAKMNQQKGRRYISAATRTSTFDSNQFTPGTELMIKLDERLKAWLEFNKRILPKRVIYSSHLDPGEGEHKIFDFVRQGKTLEGDGAHILYGLDSDLIILSLLSPLRNIFLMREDYTSLVDIDRLRTLIQDSLAFEGSDRDTLIKDFSVLVMFAGNDFLPKLPSFTRIDNYLEIFTRLYKSTKRHLVTDSDDIDFETLYKILTKFKDVENRLYVKIINEDIQRYPYPELIKSVTMEGTFDEAEFTNLWYCKQFCPFTGELASMYDNNQYYDEGEIGTMCIEFLKTMQWVYKYYTNGFKSVSNTHFYPYIYAPMGKSLHSLLSRVFSDKRKLRGRLSKLKDVGPSKNQEITAAHQLLLVLPRRSIKLIPREIVHMYDFFMGMVSPESFVIKHEGTNADWHKTAIIPPINLNLANFAFSQEKKWMLPSRLVEQQAQIFDNDKYVPKHKIFPTQIKQRMDKFNKTTDYRIRDVQLM